MSNITEKKLGYGLGLLGGLLIGLAGLFSLLLGALDLALGRPFTAAGYGTEGLVLLVVGGLSAVFAHLGYRQWSARPLSSGVVLVVLAVLGWAVLGLGANFVALIGGLFVFLGGVLYLLEPVQARASALVPA